MDELQIHSMARALDKISTITDCFTEDVIEALKGVAFNEEDASKIAEVVDTL